MLSMLEAGKTGNVEIVKVLIEHGASIDKSMTNKGRTPPFFAAQQGHSEIVKALLAHGASNDKSIVDGRTPLFFYSIQRTFGDCEGVD
jgi:uncharacterized protein